MADTPATSTPRQPSLTDAPVPIGLLATSISIVGTELGRGGAYRVTWSLLRNPVAFQ